MPEYIDRGTAIAKLTALEVIEPNATMEDARSLLADMPAADVAPVVHGRWLEVREKRLFGEHYFLCSNCKSRNGLMIPFNYCPNCGAKMDGSKA